MVKYIHYGTTKYDPSKFRSIKNLPYATKPQGGLWASRFGIEQNWFEWCRENNFRLYDEKNYFIFYLTEQAKVVTINKKEDIGKLPIIRQDKISTLIDFEQMLRNGVDAIELTNINDLYFDLYGWDCNSIVILNQNIIIPE